MAFQTKRGRPSVNRPKHDRGTNELATRHAHGFTLEPLDFCLKRQLISEAQHRAGIHLRWLHTLRFGAPTVSAYDASNMGGKALQSNDQSWKAEREAQYEAAIAALKRLNAHRIVINVCIFSSYPHFLLPTDTMLTRAAAEIRMTEMQTLFEGLDMIHRMFFVDHRK